MAQTWRLAKALEILRSQINAAFPNRLKISDGTIGDQAHAARKSDHNPNAAGVVIAMDVTHDPEHGFDSWAFAETLRLRRDPRIANVISNGRIFSSTVSPWVWRKYTGANAHAHHMHISMRPEASYYDDTSPWSILPVSPPVAVSPKPPAVLPAGVTEAMRARMAAAIIGYEVARDAAGHYAVHKPGDGSYEVAGISSNSHKVLVDQLVSLISTGQHAEVERQVTKFVIDYTAPVTGWVTEPGLEFYLRDTLYHRGPVGAAKVLQIAVGKTGKEVDGEVGQRTREALAQVCSDVPALLKKLREARETYEIAEYGKRAQYWTGLNNRWDKALRDAQTFSAEARKPNTAAGAAAAVVVAVGTAGAGTMVATPDGAGVFAIWGALIWQFLLVPIVFRNTAGVSAMMLDYDAPWWQRIRVYVSGLKRILFARLVSIMGIMLTIHELILPHISTITPLLPEKYQPLLLPAFTLIGIIFEVLLKISPQPAGQINPEVLAAATQRPVSVVADETRADPVVADPTPAQVATSVDQTGKDQG